MTETRGRADSERPTAQTAVLQVASCAALALAVTAFLAISLHQLTLPGFYYDEALDLVPMLQLIHSEPVNLLRGIGITVGGTAFPVMLLDYMGSLNGYLNLPFMLLLGPGVVAARLEPILFSALTIVLSYALARAWFGRGAAILTALLLAINPSFIWFSRQGISVTSVMTVFSLGSLLLLERWRRERSEVRGRKSEARGQKQETRSKKQEASGQDSEGRGQRLDAKRGDWRLGDGGQRSGVRNKRQEARGKKQEVRSQKSEVRSQRIEIGDWRLAGSGISNLQPLITNLPLLFAGILIGLGLWAKLLFLWWIVVLSVLALVWLVFGRSARPAERLRVMLQALPWLLGGCVIGAAPLIYYNLADLLRQPFDLSNAYTLGLVLKSLGQTTDYGVNNLDLLANLNKAIADFNVFIDGSYFWYNGVPFSNVYAVPAFVISAVAGSLLALRRPEWRTWLALLAAIAATVFISAFTVSGLWATHLFIIVPLPQMVVAVAALWLARWLGGLAARIGHSMRRPSHPESPIPNLHASRLISILSVVVVLALPISRDLWVSWQHHAKLAQTGGSGRFSDAIYKLAAYLDANHVAQPIALDWGIEKNVRVLTDDRVQPDEIFGFTTEPGALFEQRARELLRDPSRQYIVLWDRFAVYNRRKAFTQIANQMGLQVTETFIAHERSGLPVYVVLQAK